MFTQRAALFLLGTLVVLAVAPAQGCSPPVGGGMQRPDGMDAKMALSEIVLLGKAQRAIPDGKFPNDNVYSVEFEVLCIYKKPEEITINTNIIINEIGEIPGHCYATNITVGEEAIVYLSQGDDLAFRPMYSADSGSTQHREELQTLCSFSPEIPEGADTVDKAVCDPDYQYDYCQEDPEVIDEIMNPSPPTPPSPAPPITDDKTDQMPVGDTKMSKDKTDNMPGDTKMSKGKDETTPGDDKPASDQEEGKDVPYDASRSKDEESSKNIGDNSSTTLVVSLLLLALTLLSTILL